MLTLAGYQFTQTRVEDENVFGEHECLHDYPSNNYHNISLKTTKIKLMVALKEKSWGQQRY